MPPKAQRRITLSAGEECTIMGSGLVHVTLASGVLDVAGVLLEANQSHAFDLHPTQRALVVYTLEGGSGAVTSEGPLEVHRSETGAAAVAQLARRTLIPLGRSKVLVIGRAHHGKTLTAHTLCNLLTRYAPESETSLAQNVFLADLNAESNALYAPGCISAVRVAAPPLWLGRTASPERLPLAFFTGSASRPAAADVGAFLWHVQQLHETTMAWIKEQCQPANRHHLVIDAPAPGENLTEGTFYKKLIEVLQPTHVVLVSHRDGEEDWTAFLQEDVQRVLEDCEFVYVPPVARRCTAAPRAALGLEYLIGTAAAPLGCAKVVVSTQQLQCVELVRDAAQSVRAAPVHPDPSWSSMVCALSHAQLLPEVPLAPLVGLVVVAQVDVEHDEMVLIVPAGGESLPARFLVVPGAEGRPSLSLTDAEVALVEESLAV